MTAVTMVGVYYLYLALTQLIMYHVFCRESFRSGKKNRVVPTGADCICTYVPYTVVTQVQPQSVSRVWVLGARPINLFLLQSPIQLIPWWTGRYTHCEWAGGTFFQLCCCVSFLVSDGKQVLVLLTYISRVQYSCGVMLVFWFWREIVFWYYIRTQCTIHLCGCVSFLVVAGNIVVAGKVLKMRTPFDFL